MRCLGILRETQNSPNRETDDALILKAVLAELSLAGVSTVLQTPEEFDAADPRDFDLILPMCESYPRLMRLSSSTGTTRLLNAPKTVLNCYRTRMTPLLSARPETGFPPSEVRRVEDDPGSPPPFDGSGGWWVKRGDVHNTCDRDVVHVDGWDRLAAVLSDFQEREITHFILQPHVPGDLIKFYGVGPGTWFTWFYHDPGAVMRLPFSLDKLRSAAAAAASAVGVEVFGGDAIIQPGGAIAVIDINSWPSFARVRTEAAAHIARHALDLLRAPEAVR